MANSLGFLGRMKVAINFPLPLYPFTKCFPPANFIRWDVAVSIFFFVLAQTRELRIPSLNLPLRQCNAIHFWSVAFTCCQICTCIHYAQEELAENLPRTSQTHQEQLHSPTQGAKPISISSFIFSFSSSLWQLLSHSRILWRLYLTQFPKETFLYVCGT